MSASLSLSGLTALARALDRMPDGLEAKAEVAVRSAAFDAANQLRRELAAGPTGNLRRGLRVQKRDTLRYTVTSGAPHSFINEEGTKVRYTKKTRAHRGISPGSKTVARVASAQRREMHDALAQVLAQVLGTIK